jgi:hypothetical protein
MSLVIEASIWKGLFGKLLAIALSVPNCYYYALIENTDGLDSSAIYIIYDTLFLEAMLLLSSSSTSSEITLVSLYRGFYNKLVGSTLLRPSIVFVILAAF